MANPFDTNQSLSRIGRSEMMSVIDDREDVFPAVILGRTIVPYGSDVVIRYHWREVPYFPEGKWPNETTGQAAAETLTYREGNAIDCPAYETNGSTTVPDLTIVWMRRGHLHVKSSDPEDPVTGDSHGQEYLFDYPSPLMFLGVMEEELTQGSFALVNIWDEGGDTGIDLVAWDWLLSTGQTIPAGKNVVIAFMASKWWVIAAQC